MGSSYYRKWNSARSENEDEESPSDSPRDGLGRSILRVRSWGQRTEEGDAGCCESRACDIQRFQPPRRVPGAHVPGGRAAKGKQR